MTPDVVRRFLEDHLDRPDSWFEGLMQGLLLGETLDTYQVERLEEWWQEVRD